MNRISFNLAITTDEQAEIVNKVFSFCNANGLNLIRFESWPEPKAVSGAIAEVTGPNQALRK